MANEEIEMWQNKCVEMQKQLETVENLTSLDETEMKGVASGTKRVAEKPEVNKSVSNDGNLYVFDM